MLKTVEKPLGGRSSAPNPAGAYSAPRNPLAGGGLLPLPKNPTPLSVLGPSVLPPVKNPGHAPELLSASCMSGDQPLGSDDTVLPGDRGRQRAPQLQPGGVPVAHQRTRLRCRRKTLARIPLCRH